MYPTYIIMWRRFLIFWSKITTDSVDSTCVGHEDIYGTSKGPYQILEVVNTIKLVDLIWEFDTWCDMQQLQNLQQFTPFVKWRGLF